LNLKEIYSDRIVLFDEVAHPPAQAPATRPTTPEKIGNPIGKSISQNKVEQQRKATDRSSSTHSVCSSVVLKYRDDTQEESL
jgi:hypothetical protein